MLYEGVSLDDEFAHLATASLSLRDPDSVIASILSVGRTAPSLKEDAFGIASSLSQVGRAVSSLGIFSRNEIEEDVATSKLKFLLVPYLEAVALLACQGSSMERLKHVSNAKGLLQRFLHHVDELGFVRGAEREELQGNEEIVVASAPGARRQMKIMRYKQEKQAQEKLMKLHSRLRSYDSESGEDVDAEAEEQRRDAMKVMIESSVRKSLDMVGECEREMTILEYAVEHERQGKESLRILPRRQIGISDLPDSFVMISRRERMQNELFRPSHSLPAYTVEEWGEFEAKRARESTENQKKLEAEKKASRLGEEEDASDRVVDEETRKAREWDDWKDGHNKGSGNTIR